MAQIPEILENPLRQKIIDILMNNGVTDEVNEVKMFEPEHLKGEHMATATFYCSAEFKDPEVKEKNLFVKRFHNSDAHIEWGKRSRIMEKEAEFYNKFLPRLRKFCEEYNG